jgi:hypothetical protein
VAQKIASYYSLAERGKKSNAEYEARAPPASGSSFRTSPKLAAIMLQFDAGVPPKFL